MTPALIAPGQFKTIVADVETLEGRFGPMLRFSLALGCGAPEGDRWLAFKGCRAWRNWKKNKRGNCCALNERKHHEV